MTNLLSRVIFFLCEHQITREIIGCAHAWKDPSGLQRRVQPIVICAIISQLLNIPLLCVRAPSSITIDSLLWFHRPRCYQTRQLPSTGKLPSTAMQRQKQWRNYHWTRVDKVQGAPECKGPPSSRHIFFKAPFCQQNPKFTLQLDMNSPAVVLPVNPYMLRSLQYASIESFSGWLSITIQ